MSKSWSRDLACISTLQHSCIMFSPNDSMPGLGPQLQKEQIIPG